MAARADRDPIQVVLHSGLGNQMFQYAAARALAVARECGLLLDTATGFRNDPYGRRYELGAFRISATCLPGPCPEAGRLWTRIMFRATRELETRALRWSGRYYLPWLQKASLRCAGVAFGYWQSPRYFEKIDTSLRQEFQLKDEPCPEIGECAARLRGRESVAVHVRLQHGRSDTGEVVSPKLAAARSEDAALGYYRAAVAYLGASVAHPEWFIVSDSGGVDPVRLGLPRGTPVVGPGSGRSPAEDLWLLSQARHRIIGPSTFGWWGAYLSAHEGGMVLAPRIFRPGGSRRPARDVYPPGWITLGDPT